MTKQNNLPAAKCASIDDIASWIPAHDLQGIKIGNAWKIIRVHYCAALVGRGVCPIDCQVCREAIIGMFQFREKPRNAEALLTWQAKDKSAEMIERLILESKDEREEGEFPARETSDDPLASLFPKRRDENPFLELLKDYE